MEMTSLCPAGLPQWMVPLYTVTNSAPFCSPAKGLLGPAGTLNQAAIGEAAGRSEGKSGERRRVLRPWAPSAWTGGETETRRGCLTRPLSYFFSQNLAFKVEN